jgi:DNA-binding transcriptional regulator LsrR (DeoR family)
MITVGDYNTYPPLKFRNLTREQVAEILEAYTNEGITAMELSKKYNIPFQKVSWLIEQHLLPTRAEETRIIAIQSKV